MHVDYPSSDGKVGHLVHQDDMSTFCFRDATSGQLSLHLLEVSEVYKLCCLLAFYILFLQYNARLTTYLDLLMSSRVPAGDWLGVLKLLLHSLHHGLAVQALEGVMNQL